MDAAPHTDPWSSMSTRLSSDGPLGRWVGRVVRSSRTVVHRRPLLAIVAGFAGAVLVGTVLLALPLAGADGSVGLLPAFFTAVSAVCVTGLTVVDTATAWSGFGHAVILVLVQLGGFGITTFAALLALLVSRRLGLQTRILAAASTSAVSLRDLRALLVMVGKVTVAVEGVVALVLGVRWWAAYDEPPLRALWLGVFHSVSAYNNAGFALWTDSLGRFVADPWVVLTVCLATFGGSLGVPVVVELLRRTKPRRWTLHTKITLLVSGLLVPLGALFVLAAEWGNPATLGGLSGPGKGLTALLHSVMTRSGGFSTVDVAAMHDGTWFGTDVLMFIGGGSASTAGGIKVTTFAVLAAVIWAELRGDPDVTFFEWRIPPAVQRQAAVVALVGVAAVVLPTLLIALTSTLRLDQVLFEVISASATVGLSTGITASLTPWHQVLLAVLMFVGRLGPLTLGAALALREKVRVVRRPEGRPVIG